MQPSAPPAGGRDGVVAPWLAHRQWSHLETAVPSALERDGALDRRYGLQVIDGHGDRVADRAADLERAVVHWHREVAAHVVELDRSDVSGERLGWGFRVEGCWVDHPQRGARAFAVVSYSHACSASS
jgi:hypothetical protein